MLKLKTKLSQTSALRALRKLKRDDDGVAAIEFALIAPVLIFMYLGLLEVSLGIMADRDVSHATNVAGDLATQVAILDKAEIEDVFTAAYAVMAARPGTNSDINMQLESFHIDPVTNAPASLGTAKIGTVTEGGANLTQLQTMNLLTATSGVVVATINYQYTPVGVTYFAKDAGGNAKKINLNETFVLKPRRSADIPIEDASGTKKDYICSFGADDPNTAADESNNTITCS